MEDSEEKDAKSKAGQGLLQELHSGEVEAPLKTLEPSNSTSSSKPLRPASAARRSLHDISGRPNSASSVGMQQRPLPEISGKAGGAAPSARPSSAAPKRRMSSGTEPRTMTATPEPVAPLQDAAEDRICRAVISAVKAEMDMQAQKIFVETRQAATEMQGNLVRELKEVIQQLRAELDILGSAKSSSSSDIQGSAVKSLDNARQQTMQQGAALVRQPEASGSDPSFVNTPPPSTKGNGPQISPYPPRNPAMPRVETQQTYKDLSSDPHNHADPGLLGAHPGNDASPEWGLVQVGPDGEPITDVHGHVRVLLPDGQVAMMDEQQFAFPSTTQGTALPIQDAYVDDGVMVPMDAGAYATTAGAPSNYNQMAYIPQGLPVGFPGGYAIVAGENNYPEEYYPRPSEEGHVELVRASMHYSTEGDLILVQSNQAQEMLTVANSNMYRSSAPAQTRPVSQRRRPDIVRVQGRRQLPPATA